MEQPLADLVGPDLRVLFCGINPGKLSGELGLHFARAGNRFWRLLCAGGFTESVLSPEEQHVLPALGVGITNLVARVTAAASELSASELREGARCSTPRSRSYVLAVSRCWDCRRTGPRFVDPAQPSGPSPNDWGEPFFGSCPTRAACRLGIKFLK